MARGYKKVFMPREFIDEVNRFLENSEYGSVSELCRVAGEQLVERNRLRERYAS